MAQRKKSMIKEGSLDKYGRPNDKTPKDWDKVHPKLEKMKAVTITTTTTICIYVYIFRS